MAREMFPFGKMTWGAPMKRRPGGYPIIYEAAGSPDGETSLTFVEGAPIPGKVADYGFFQYARARFPCRHPVAVRSQADDELTVGTFVMFQDVVELPGAARPPFLCKVVQSRTRGLHRF